MIIDLARFIEKEKPFWAEFDQLLDAHSRGAASAWPLAAVKRFHFLYEKVSSDLVKISTFSGERELRSHLGSLVARGYAAIHARQRRTRRIGLLDWFLRGFPATFRRTIAAFHVAAFITIAGCVFGGIAVLVEPDAKEAIIPGMARELLGSPSERVKDDEQRTPSGRERRTAGAAWYMTHNTRVSIFAVSLGMTFGIGTVALLFYNGAMLGAIVVDYVADGHGLFVTGWLLPHGVVEIPAILIAGQAGLLLAVCLIRPGGRSRKEKLRERLPDVVSLVCGVALMLVWAGIVESFFSPYHAGVLPYWFKIAFGLAEGAVLVTYLSGGFARLGARP